MLVQGGRSMRCHHRADPTGRHAVGGGATTAGDADGNGEPMTARCGALHSEKGGSVVRARGEKGAGASGSIFQQPTSCVFAPNIWSGMSGPPADTLCSDWTNSRMTTSIEWGIGSSAGGSSADAASQKDRSRRQT